MLDHMNIGRVDVLGVGISTVDMERAVGEITRWVVDNEHHYVCVTGVHGVMESQNDAELRKIHNESGLTVPDGIPMVWCGHRAGAKDMAQVRGSDLTLALLAEAERREWKSFFYGGKEGVPELLAQRLKERFPNLKIVGTYSPPFRPLTEEEDDAVVAQINASGADVVWVGLSTPKQERWAASHVSRLNASAILAVGAAFDFHAGLVPEAPEWTRKRGLEWFYRLYKEPRRLWKRYLRNNPLFVAAILRRPPKLRDTNASNAA